MDKKSNVYIIIIVVVVIAVIFLAVVLVFYNCRRNHSKQQATPYPVEPLRSPTLSAHGVLIENGSASWKKTPTNGDFIFSFDNAGYSHQKLFNSSDSPEQRRVGSISSDNSSTNNNIIKKEELPGI